MARKSTLEKPKRPGTAFWFPDDHASLLRAVAAAEDRSLQTVLARALHAYAAKSREYQRTQREGGG